MTCPSATPRGLSWPAKTPTSAGATLNLHANISRRLIDALTVTTIYQTNPHVDARLRAADFANLVVRTARGEMEPRQALVQLPLVVNIARQGTSEIPLAHIMATAQKIGRRPGMLWAGVAEGFPYADVPQMGMSFVAISDGSQDPALAAAEDLGALVWSYRDDLQAIGLSVAEALDLADDAQDGPTALLDVGDNIMRTTRSCCA